MGRVRQRVEALEGSDARAQLAQAQAIQDRQEALRLNQELTDLRGQASELEECRAAEMREQVAVAAMRIEELRVAAIEDHRA
eukprot:4213169-Alexandrium_andersonii.AAC.1